MEEQKNKDLTEEQRKKFLGMIEKELEAKKTDVILGGPFEESRRSSCMLVLIIPLIISITIACLINFK